MVDQGVYNDNTKKSSVTPPVIFAIFAIILSSTSQQAARAAWTFTTSNLQVSGEYPRYEGSCGSNPASVSGVDFTAGEPSVTISFTVTGTFSGPGAPTPILEHASCGGSPYTANDGFSDPDSNNSSSGGHLSTPTSPTISKTITMTATNIAGPTAVEFSYSIQNDNRSVSIISSLGLTYSKPPVAGMPPVPNLPDAAGTVHADTVEWPFPYIGQITYSASAVGSWAAGSSYLWNTLVGTQIPSGLWPFPAGTFTLPSNPIPSCDAGYFSLNWTTPLPLEQACIDCTDAGDGAHATGNYYVQFHQPNENWVNYANGQDMFQPYDPDEIQSLGYLNGDAVASYEYPYYLADSAVASLFTTVAPIVPIPGAAALVAVIGATATDLQPQMITNYSASYNFCWNDSYSTFDPPTSSSTPTSAYQMVPELIVEYAPHFYHGDAYGSQGYTGVANFQAAPIVGKEWAGVYTRISGTGI